MRKKSISLTIFCFAAFLLSLLPVAAQDNAPDEVYIQYVETSPNQDGTDGPGLGLDVYFTVKDASGQIVPSTDIASAEITVTNFGNREAKVSQPKTDFYITFVLDVSGSMRENDAIFYMRDAAVAAINSAPAGAHFSIIAFDHEVMPQIDSADGFTDQPNIAINRVVALQERDGGTCLYDAAYRAVQQISTVPSPRRAIILFTDGRDEFIRGGELDTCSTHPFTEVIQKAESSGTAIHTIGMQGSDLINEDELTRMAYQTQGFPVIGTQANLNNLFQQIMAGLSSQYLASTTAYVSPGTQEGILRVTLNNGDKLQAGIFQFTSSTDYVRTPTPAAIPPTSTPMPPNIEVVGTQTDTINKQVSFELEVENGQRISEYLFRFMSEDTGLQQQEEVRSAPLNGPITFSIPDWPTGCYTIRVTAYGSNGDRLTTAESSRFCYALPTPTPTRTPTPTITPSRTPTPTQTLTPTQTHTPVPVGATLNSVRFNEDENTFQLNLTIRSRNQVNELKIEFFNTTTNQPVGMPSFWPPQEIINIAATEYPEADYRVKVTTLNSAGEALLNDEEQAIVSEYNFRHILPTPIPSATFTPTATETPTATAVVVTVILNPPREGNGELIFPLRTENEHLVSGYEVVLIKQSGIALAPISYTAPLSEIRVPLGDVEGGEYNVEIRALDNEGTQLAEARLARGISVSTPVPPTPTPQPTATPIPPSFPSIPWMVANTTIVVPAIIILIVGLLLVLLLLVRTPKARPTGTGFLDELTRAQEARDIPPAYAIPSSGEDADKTNYDLQFDPDATNFDLQLPLPTASLTVKNSGDKSVVGRSVSIDQVPFKIGRKATNSFSVQGDRNMSNEHAVITFSADTFYITDLGSTHGTVVDDQKIAPSMPTPLASGAKIRLAETTIFIFERQADNPDPDSQSTEN